MAGSSPMSAAPRGDRPVPTRPVPPRINEQQAFVPAVLSDAQFAEIKQLTIEQYVELTAQLAAINKMMIPMYELSKVMLMQFITQNISSVDPKLTKERDRLIKIASEG